MPTPPKPNPRNAARGRPATPKRRFARARLLAYAAATLLTAVLLAACYAEWRYGFLRTGPRVSRAPVTNGSGITAIVDPAKLADLSAAEIRSAAGWPVPYWAVRRMLPHEGGVAAMLNFDQQRAELRVYINPNALTPVARRLGDTLRFSDAFPKIRWKKGAAEPARGLFMKEGVIPFAQEAEEAFFYTWNQSMPLAPVEFEGGHLLEVVFDNRQGLAFLAVASLLEAYNIQLGQNETDISLSSLQFVREARLTADLSSSDTLHLRFVLDILPEEVDKLGVINLKVGLDDVFKEYAERWERQHGLKLEGDSSWDGPRIIYEYRLASATKAFHLLVTGELH